MCICCLAGRQGRGDALGALDPQLDRGHPGALPALRAARLPLGGDAANRGRDVIRRPRGTTGRQP